MPFWAVPPPSSARTATAHLTLRLAFYAIAVSMALIHAFITFRGLSSPDGMEQAQMAREMARGHLFQTKVIRPYAWARLIATGNDPVVTAMPEISQPPLQAVVWAPVFKLLRRYQTFEPEKGGAVYLLDRAIACMGVTCYLLTILFMHGAARRLFDESVATITALILVLCEPLWNLAISGNPAGLLLLLFALAFRFQVIAASRVAQGESAVLSVLAVGLLSGLMVLTHWMAVWLVFGLVLAAVITLAGKRALAIWVAFPPFAALMAWGLWTNQRSGDFLGGAKALFQSHILVADTQSLEREFSLAMPPMDLDSLLRKLGQNWQAQSGDLVAHLAWLLPALFFFTALLHGFRRSETGRVKLGLGLIFVSVALGMGLLGLPERSTDDKALYLVLAPAMTAFGVAMMAILWTKLQPGGTMFWSRWGYAIIAVVTAALPMLANLPIHLKMGLTMGKQIVPQWPPYVPERVALVRNFVEPNEVVFADAPWFVAWYADVPAVWLPVKRSDFGDMKAKIEAQGKAVAGVVITPLSSRATYITDTFNNSYREWPDLVFRGPMIAFDRDFKPRPDFPYQVPLPLVAQPVGGNENLSILMVFYMEKARKPRE